MASQFYAFCDQLYSTKAVQTVVFRNSMDPHNVGRGACWAMLFTSWVRLWTLSRWVEQHMRGYLARDHNTGNET